MTVRTESHGTFLEWYGVARNRFLVPVEIGPVTDQGIELRFPTATPALSATLTPSDILVSAELGGQHWDIVRAFETALEEVQGGYVCGLCSPETRRVYPSRNQFWVEHLFEEFLSWVNSELLRATAIGFWGDMETGTWARLLTKEQVQTALPRVAPPLWRGHAPR